MARRVRVRGIVKGGAGFAQSRRPDGEWDLWRVGVSLRPWRLEGGDIETSTVGLRRHTRLPFWLWRLLLPKNATVELLAELGLEGEQGGRLVAWRGFRRDRDLRQVQRGWRSERTLDHPAFGRFTFDERLDWFETKANWLGRRVPISIGMGRDGHADAEPAAKAFAEAEAWDHRARNLAVDQLLAVHNENWLGDGERPLSKEEFKARMTLESIGFNPGPYIQFFFEDGDLFAGHTIIVTFDQEAGDSWAEFAG